MVERNSGNPVVIKLKIINFLLLKHYSFFTIYKADYKITPLLNILPQMSRCLKKHETHQCISFKNKDEKLLEKYKSIWNRISNVIENDFDGQPIYGGKYLNTQKTISLFLLGRNSSQSCV